MPIILTLTEDNVIHDSPAPKPTTFTDRLAARAIMFDAAGKVALLKVLRQNYHKLPGGGIEGGEDLAKTLERELLEETGCRAKVTGDVGVIVEYRNQWGLRQTSHCYIAQKISGQQDPNFTAEELEDGFVIAWAKNISEAIKLLQMDQPKNYDGLFIQQRDLAFLKAAEQLI